MDTRTTYRRLVVTALGLAFVVVVFGAFVRLSDAGLGCPDWPGCYGHVGVPASEAALAQVRDRFPDSVVEHRKAWIEMIHRYLAGVLGLLVLALAVLGVRWSHALGQSPALAVGLVGLVMVQAAFGMWTVTLLLMPVIVTTHLLGGMTTLALLAWLAARQSPLGGLAPARRPAPRWAWAALIAVGLQIALGGWVSTNYAGMACPDYPLCHGALLPDMDFSHGFTLWRQLGVTAAGEPLSNASLNAIQWLHRKWALVVLAAVLFAAWKARHHRQTRAAGTAAGLLVLAQAGIGIANVLWVLPLPLAVAHNAGAAALLVMLVVLNFRACSA
ncbi:MAG: COX15/CtaA family protein [Betaproteobacteria bacterium]